MLLQKLKLSNIRSYQEETVSFPEGTMLLSGDIGCGKSSILLAIEFALFGTARPDLPGESLLRKGAGQGSVELQFQLHGQEIIIKRSLKKEKAGIKQTAGHIIINNLKKELMPVELKSEVVSLLGYPEDVISKNKNYIFRYTVYTPQEEMKFILQENSEIRLDALRKIFNVDKYKNIRENLQYYLKQMRSQIATLKTRTEPLDEQREQIKELKKEKETIETEVQELSPRLERAKLLLNQHKKDLESLETAQKEFMELQHQKRKMLALLEEKNKFLQQLIGKQEKVKVEITQFSLPEEANQEQVRVQLQELELQKNEFLTKKTELHQKISQLQLQLKDNQEDVSLLMQDTAEISGKQQLFEGLSQELSHKAALQEKREQLEELFEQTSQMVVKNETLLAHSKETQEKIKTLQECPTCLQQVTRGHKNSIIEQETRKIQQAENLLFETSKKRSEIFQQRDETRKKIEELLQKENLHTRTKIELEQLEKKKEELEKKREHGKSLAKENNMLIQEQERRQTEQKEKELNRKQAELQSLLDTFTKMKILEQQVREYKEQITSHQEEITKLTDELQQTDVKLDGKEDLAEKIDQQKKVLLEANEREKLLSVKQAELQTQLKSHLKQEEQLQQALDKLTEQKNKLIKLKELYHWLEQHFLPLTVTIEKQVMTNIHHLFNQLFRDWFSILIEDENVYSRIDDSFTPIIEQNGYEISFENLSGGEKTSAALAYRLALNRVINDVIHQIRTRDLLILDEPTDGFSSEQLDKVRDVLERLHLRQTIIVSHESKVESFVQNVVRIVKEGHISRVYG